MCSECILAEYYIYKLAFDRRILTQNRPQIRFSICCNTELVPVLRELRGKSYLIIRQLSQGEAWSKSANFIQIFYQSYGSFNQPGQDGRKTTFFAANSSSCTSCRSSLSQSLTRQLWRQLWLSLDNYILCTSIRN